MPELIGKLNVTFKTLVGSGLQNDVVRQRFRASDGRLYEIDIDPACAPLMMVDLQRRLSEASPTTVQPIIVNAIQRGLTESGDQVLILDMDGGGELTLQFRSGDLSALVEELQKIGSPKGVSKQ